MTIVTVQCAAIKGKLTLRQSENDPSVYEVSSRYYEEKEIEANDISGALSVLLSNITNLRPSAEQKAKSAIRSKLMRDRIAANGGSLGGGRPRQHKRKQTGAGDRETSAQNLANAS